jgi:hypothetical protein
VKHQNTHCFEKDELLIEEIDEFKIAEQNAKLWSGTLCFA